jgi:hypothetical protein
MVADRVDLGDGPRPTPLAGAPVLAEPAHGGKA